MNIGERGEIAKNVGNGPHGGEARRRSRRLAPGVIGVCLVMIVASSLALVSVPGARASPTLSNSTAVKVPCGGNIQAAINAAPSGGTIFLAPCTYVQQLTITTPVNLVGAGVGRTTIQSPAGLAADSGVISISNGATASLTGFTVSLTVPNLNGVLVTGATATIQGLYIQATVFGSIGIALSSSVATITSNVIVATATPVDAEEIGILAEGSQLTVTHNVIQGPALDGMFFVLSFVKVEFNIVSEFSCSYSPSLVEADLCGPNWAYQLQGSGIGDFGDTGLGSTIAYNLIYSADAGILLDGCPACVVTGNTIWNSFDYGLAGMDGTYTLGPNTVVGGAYGVAAAAAVTDTAVTLSHVLIVAPSVAPLYIESDFGYTATIGGTWTVIG